MIEPPHPPQPPIASAPPSPGSIASPSAPLLPIKPSVAAPLSIVPVADANDPNASRWFLDNSSGRILRYLNTAKYYVNASDAWNSISVDLSMLSDPEHDFAYFLGWEMGITGPNDMLVMRRSPDVTLADLLKKASDASIAIRAMLANLLQSPKQNKTAVEYINSLKNGSAIWDDRVPLNGTHHQKAVIIQHKQGLVAYCGGIDLHPSRENWNDAYCRLEGPAAYDLHSTFVERWQDYTTMLQHIPDVIRKLFVKRIDLGPPAAGLTLTSPASTRVCAQVVRTYPNGPKHGGVQVRESPVSLVMKREGYRFAANGEHSIYDLIRTALRATKSHIYMQDQYLFAATLTNAGPSIAQLLADKLKEDEFKCLIILISRTESINSEVHQAWQRRAEFLSILRSAEPSKVAVCQYRIAPKKTCDYVYPTYVHAKCWVFDDRFAIIGSANCNRRGYTHDSELAVGIYDEVSNNDRLTFAHEFRIALWVRALNEIIEGVGGLSSKVAHNDVVDFVQASHYWFAPSSNSPIAPYDPNQSSSVAANSSPDSSGPVPPLSRDQNWNLLIDPDGS
jgi:phosphatidylserine/phosphatidylglycerophosphate/cardiolipin synthase-like enzyme